MIIKAFVLKLTVLAHSTYYKGPGLDIVDDFGELQEACPFYLRSSAAEKLQAVLAQLKVERTKFYTTFELDVVPHDIQKGAKFDYYIPPGDISK